ncbi:MAG: polysaccharide biosynthesis/export family protein [Minwuia sp.]|uniref:polysaccharide biosynthesis/export family protein n=1 Tax=Minwuia sp. TaxID=2493630 RepID=UPI003A85A757
MFDIRFSGKLALAVTLLVAIAAVQGCADRRYGRAPVQAASATPTPTPPPAQPVAPTPPPAQPVAPAPPPAVARTPVQAEPLPAAQPPRPAPAAPQPVTPAPAAAPVVTQSATVKTPVPAAPDTSSATSATSGTPTPLTDEAVAQLTQGQGDARNAAVEQARRDAQGQRIVAATNTASNDPTPVGTVVRGRPEFAVDDVPNDVAQKLEEYRMGPGDRVQIKVFGQDDISGEFEISAAGELSYPLIGQITAENMTPGEFNEVLRLALEEYFVNPQVTVEITNYRPFFILGQVGSPGTYKYQPGLNARMAIATGGGYTRRAKEEPITIFRTDSAGNLIKFDADQDATILPGDTIEVHRRLF